MTEHHNQTTVLNTKNTGNLRLFRNNVGMLFNDRGTPVNYGLQKGSHDLIGITSITITPEMIGRTIGVFTSIEMKKTGWKPPKPTNKKAFQKHYEQVSWMNFVKKFGGISYFCDNGNLEEVKL